MPFETNQRSSRRLYDFFSLAPLQILSIHSKRSNHEKRQKIAYRLPRETPCLILEVLCIDFDCWWDWIEFRYSLKRPSRSAAKKGEKVHQLRYNKVLTTNVASSQEPQQADDEFWPLFALKTMTWLNVHWIAKDSDKVSLITRAKVSFGVAMEALCCEIDGDCLFWFVVAINHFQ